MTVTHILSHLQLGQVQGNDHGSTVQFLGLKYGNIASSLSPPTIRDGNNSDILDATQFGPSAPSPQNGIENEFSHIQHPLPYSPNKQSATECLNLNITVPKHFSSSGKLPVVVFIHGGGYSIGSNSWPQYDFRRLVDLSVQNSSPIVGININYRLGLYGFLHSEELSSQGYVQNNALHDQRTALLWIKKYIDGFGGDPLNVTVVGISAGGASGTLHLHSKIPLFKRLVSMSGTNLLLKPLPSLVNEITYKRVCEALGLEGLTPAKRIDALKNLPAEKTLKALPPNLPFLPSMGGDLDLPVDDYESIYKGESRNGVHPAKSWCEQIMIGDCQMDGSIMSLMIGPPSAEVVQRFKRTIENNLGIEKATLVFDAYNITDTASFNDNYQNILNFCNDIGFLAPVLCYAHGWDANAFVYFFTEPNTWEGPWKNRANHILDVAYLFQNYKEHLSPAQQETAAAFGIDLINFANGRAPWPVFNFAAKEINAKVYGATNPESVKSRVEVVSGPSPRTERRQTIFSLSLSIPLTRLSEAWNAFLTG
ncbi:hypothetical protein EYB26_000790 [Talaromyces marneffei]|uniref:uncharacterized protein n=1 Tax=Talaromyces marneffei TaxID=37727 RepID=UPI0012AA90EE|nr:uncharacterized protein EYB26_000790 [Talaromyces marneffei]QGA13143.1 hypothetical protein EYB26_000790 [Talaromyces marneffei]